MAFFRRADRSNFCFIPVRSVCAVLSNSKPSTLVFIYFPRQEVQPTEDPRSTPIASCLRWRLHLFCVLLPCLGNVRCCRRGRGYQAVVRVGAMSALRPRLFGGMACRCRYCAGLQRAGKVGTDDGGLRRVRHTPVERAQRDRDGKLGYFLAPPNVLLEVAVWLSLLFFVVVGENVGMGLIENHRSRAPTRYGIAASSIFFSNTEMSVSIA